MKPLFARGMESAPSELVRDEPLDHRDVDVRDSEPGDTFVSAAIKAVEKWEFQPVSENGVLVEKRVGVRMMFALE